MTAATAANKRIGRFDIVRELGSGAQGTVYLASDSRLDRQVALKTLRRGAQDAAQNNGNVITLLDEARIVSRLQHPNIVTLFDAGEDGGLPYLVFEYVEGQPLDQLIADDTRPTTSQAIDIAIGVLRGMAWAHGKQVLHRDIKPANVMLTERGIPRIMDFGIARREDGGKIADSALFGTPCYMAPEYIATQTFVAASDVYAVGILLYELLTGAPPVTGRNVYEVLHKIANSPFTAPSTVNPAVDERLDTLVMKALQKNPDDRFPSAESMAQALADYLVPQSQGATQIGASQGTLEFLLRRIRHKSDFPALGNSISAINKITSSDREPTSKLCDVILKDVALASKVLKVVNASTYLQFGGAINTISRAVAILGFETIRNIATSLLLFENLQNKSQAAALRDETSATYFSAVLANELVRALGIRGAEESFLCGMFHRLGRLLVTFYLHEDKQAIEALAQSRGWSEDRAALEILGMSYDDIGIGVARQWNFPESIINSMRPLGDRPLSRAELDKDRLRIVSNLTAQLVDAIGSVSESERNAKLDQITAKYGVAVRIDRKIIASTLASAVETYSRDTQSLGSGTTKARCVEQARGWSKQILNPAPSNLAGRDSASNGNVIALPTAGTGFEPGNTTSMMAQTQLVDPGAVAAFDNTDTPNPNRQAVLAAGVQDITNSLVGEYALNDVLRMILETMYRGIGFQRVFICVRDPKRNALLPRFGFGSDVEDIIRSGFSIPLEERRDVFYAATGKGADICIDDLDSPKVRDYLPDWYRRAITAHGLVLFPVLINAKPLALIYADSAGAEGMRFKPEELHLLKTLRNQAILAIRQKS